VDRQNHRVEFAWLKSATLALSLALAGVGLGSCGGSDEPTNTKSVEVSESGACAAVRQRVGLGESPPELPGYQLRNQDVDNFSGRDGPTCNVRQMVFWGPAPTSPDADRLAIFARFQFYTQSASAQRAALLLGGGEEITLLPGARTTAYRIRGSPTAAFSFGKALITVEAGCVDPSGELLPVQCARISDNQIRRETAETVRFLERELRAPS
jgi:hypothetical protein